MSIDWTDPSAKISNHFSVKEALLLPSWGVLHVPSDAEKDHIINMAGIMDRVRDLINKPINVHCWIRPTVANCPNSDHDGENYNAAAGSTSPHSAHITGNAVDWDCGENCDDTRAKLLPELKSLGLRMENKPGSTWVHLDNMPVPPGGNRYFIP